MSWLNLFCLPIKWRKIFKQSNFGQTTNIKKTKQNLINGGPRNTEGLIANRSFDHVFTSPPYLNNFDYADRTRLELYFWGHAKSWGDISQKIRTVLMTSATTQISRTDVRYEILGEFSKKCPKVTDFIGESVEKLAILRKTKGGK